MTYNVHRCVGSDGAEDAARVAEVVAHHRPDVICIQEVVVAARGGDEVEQPAALSGALGLRHGAVGLNCRRRRGTYGNMTLARFPVEDHENLDLTLRFSIPRGGLYTRLRLPNHADLHVMNVHLGLGGYERPAQMRRVFSRLGEVARRSEPVLVLGDVNDWRNRLVRGAVRAAGFRCITGDERDPGPPTFPSRAPLGALDKIFVAGPVRVRGVHVSRLALARVASDHLPVVADLEIVPA
jgi:endonuclease/exonuclease/phosphatase family metal-dependent hydrolase